MGSTGGTGGVEDKVVVRVGGSRPAHPEGSRSAYPYDFPREAASQQVAAQELRQGPTTGRRGSGGGSLVSARHQPGLSRATQLRQGRRQVVGVTKPQGKVPIVRVRVRVKVWVRD